MNKLEIVSADISNIEDIERLESQLLHDKYSKELIEVSLIDNSYLNIIAKNDSGVVGYLSAKIVLDECEIIKIVVDKGCRRQGVAMALMNYLNVVVSKSGIKSIMLEVRKDNYAAISLYIKSGFIKNGERKNYYKDCDAELYFKEVK